MNNKLIEDIGLPAIKQEINSARKELTKAIRHSKRQNLWFRLGKASILPPNLIAARLAKNKPVLSYPFITNAALHVGGEYLKYSIERNIDNQKTFISKRNYLKRLLRKIKEQPRFDFAHLDSSSKMYLEEIVNRIQERETQNSKKFKNQNSSVSDTVARLKDLTEISSNLQNGMQQVHNGNWQQKKNGAMKVVRSAGMLMQTAVPHSGASAANKEKSSKRSKKSRGI